MTVIMITRLQLNLKKANSQSVIDSSHNDFDALHPAGPVSELHFANRNRLYRDTTGISSLFSIGNLGEDVQDPLRDNSKRRRRDKGRVADMELTTVTHIV